MRFREIRRAVERPAGEFLAIQLQLADPKSRVMDCREGVPFCGFLFHPGLAPRVLGATKRRFQKRAANLRKAGDLRKLSLSTFAWYQFSGEGNTTGLRRGWSRPGKTLPGITLRTRHS